VKTPEQDHGQGEQVQQGRILGIENFIEQGLDEIGLARFEQAGRDHAADGDDQGAPVGPGEVEDALE